MQFSFFDTPVLELAASPAAPPPARAIIAMPEPVAAVTDYIIQDNDQVGAGGAMSKVRINLEIIKLLKRIKDENRAITALEQKLLVRYSGWGHTSQPFHPQAKGKWAELQAQMRPNFTNQEWKAASFSTINAHYTSVEVIRFIWSVVQHLGFEGGKVLEPALGVGHFFGLMPADIKANSKLYGCELDDISGAVARLLYPSARIVIDAFELAMYEAGFFDLSISNVPFANVGVRDPKFYSNGRSHLAGVGLHNYYFLKTLELTRPGGLIAFITSRYTMDSVNADVREYIVRQADFLGSVRLPVTAFKRNAHTEVTTDIIFLMKRNPDLPIPITSQFITTLDRGEYQINTYYEVEPAAMMGQMQIKGGRYKNEVECVLGADVDLAEALQRRLKLFPQAIYKPAALVKKRQQVLIETETFDNPPSYGWIRQGSYAQDDWYRVWQMGKYKQWGRAKLDGKQLSRVRGMIEVRDAFHKAVQANVMLYSDDRLAKAQQELQVAYRRYISKFGYLNEPANISAFADDADGDNILALERWDPETGKAERAAIFTGRLLEPETRPDRADNAFDALIISLRETGKVDFERMAELTDLIKPHLIEELAGKIYNDPVLAEWVTADEYLSGNVRKKIEAAEQYGLEMNVLALREVLPPDVPAANIFVQLGAPWVPVDVLDQFIAGPIFDDPHHDQGVVRAVYLKTMGFYRLDTTGQRRLVFSAENKQTWGTARMVATDLIEKALNGQKPTIHDIVQDAQGRDKKVVNQEATLVARAKQAEIKEAFIKWIWANPERSSRLERIYNERFNSTVPRAYDGSPLIFPGLNPAIILRQIQKNVIWRALQDNALMIAHGVGFGKTFSQICTAMRLKQLGLRQRIMVVVKRATFGQFAAAIRDAYPLVRMSPIASGQTAAHRRRQMARIVTDDFDLIITTHPIFGKIPLKVDTINLFMDQQMDEIEAAILEADDDISQKELEKAKKRLQNKIDKMIEKSRAAQDQNQLFFEDLAIDTLIVDESGAFKNLFFYSSMTRISGVGGSESGRAYDMKLKIRTLQANKGTIIFATGTPLENSISEVFSMMSFLMPEELKEMGMHHFDAWAQTFGQVQTSVEMKPDGSGFRMAERFSAFNNLPQLKRLWLRVADTQMNGDVAGIVRPDIATGKAIGMQCEPYPELKEIIKTLANRASNLDGKDLSADNMLVIINHADKASLDPRLLGRFTVINQEGQPTGEHVEIKHDYAGSKVNLCVAQVAEIYHNTRGVELPGQPGKHDLTQLIFLDSSTPTKKMGASMGRLPVRDEYGKKTGKWTEIHDPDNVLAFTVYEDIYRKLVAAGIPPQQIAFAQEYSDDHRKSKLAAMINAGKLAVVIGHTEIMGIGLNCQRLLVALHHLDCPWKPAWIEQREGRIWRHGNLCPLISIYSYVMSGSFDVYRWQTLERKASFIEAFNSPDLTMLSIEDPGAAVMSAKEMVALATGNTSIIRQVEIQTKLRVLTAQWNEHRGNVSSAEGRINRLTRQIEEDKARIAQRAITLGKIQAEGGIATAEAYGKGLYALCEPHFETYGEYVPLGELYGIPIFYRGVEYRDYSVGEGVAGKRKGVSREYWGAVAEGNELEKAAPVEGEEAAPVEAAPPPEPKKVVDRRFFLENQDLNFRADFKLRVIEDTRDHLNATELIELFGEILPKKQSEQVWGMHDSERRIEESRRQLEVPFVHFEEMEKLRAELTEVEAEIKRTLGEVDAEERQAARSDLDVDPDRPEEEEEVLEDEDELEFETA